MTPGGDAIHFGTREGVVVAGGCEPRYASRLALVVSILNLHPPCHSPIVPPSLGRRATAKTSESGART